MNKKLAALYGAVLALVLLIGYGRAGVLAQPGDVNDPLVTKRYVDEQLDGVKALIGQGGLSAGGGGASVDRDALFADMMAYMDAVYGGAVAGGQTGAGLDAGPQGQAPYEAVFAEAGRTVVGLSGTEMILRSGGAVAVAGVNGLCDVTIGMDVANGDAVVLNHLLIVPGGDGRGMRMTADAYLMIKGGYYFVD